MSIFALDLSSSAASWFTEPTLLGQHLLAERRRHLEREQARHRVGAACERQEQVDPAWTDSSARQREKPPGSAMRKAAFELHNGSDSLSRRIPPTPNSMTQHCSGRAASG